MMDSDERGSGTVISKRDASTAAFMKPKEMRILIAGDLDKLKEGAAKEHVDLDAFGPLVEVPIRDPMK